MSELTNDNKNLFLQFVSPFLANNSQKLNMKKLFFVSIFLYSSLIIHSQTPTIQWQRSLGGTSDDVACSIKGTIDGGYIVAGGSHSNDGDVTGNHGGYDYWVVKLNSLGSIQWQKSLGGSANEIASSIQQTTDGGYIVVGQSTSNDGDVTGHHGIIINDDYWVVKLDNSGNIQWQKSLGGTQNDSGLSIQQTTDGGYIVTGYSGSNDGDVTGNHGTIDYWVVKLDNSGNIQWQKSLGGTGDENGYFIQQTLDGGYIVAGYSNSNDGDVTGNNGANDYWVVKLDSLGSIQWQKCFGTPNSDMAYSIQQTLDGGYIIVGSSGTPSWDYWIVKIDSLGFIQWQKSLGGTAGELGYSIQQTIDGGYIVTGQSSSNNGDVTGNHGAMDYWLVKVDALGVIQWQKSLGGTGSDFASSTQQITNCVYIVAGHSVSNNGDVTGNHGMTDCWIVKLNSCHLTSSVVSTNTNCVACTGTGTVTTTGGSSPYTYSWNTNPIQTTQTATGLCEGNYTATVADVDGITTTVTVTITELNNVTATVDANQVIVSVGDSTQLIATGGGIYSWFPTSTLGCTDCPNPMATPEETTDYCVVVTDTSGCSDSACIKIIVENGIFIPNAFTPDQDNLNDVFKPSIIEAHNYNFLIYNRWGEMIFETSNANEGWNGYYKGKICEGGVYVYKINFIDNTNKAHQYIGKVTLLR